MCMYNRRDKRRRISVISFNVNDVLQLSSSSPDEQSFCPSHNQARSRHLPSLHSYSYSLVAHSDTSQLTPFSLSTTLTPTTRDYLGQYHDGHSNENVKNQRRTFNAKSRENSRSYRLQIQKTSFWPSWLWPSLSNHDYHCFINFLLSNVIHY